MIKLDIINEVVNRTGITKTKAEMAVETVFETMKRALSEGDRIELRGFGIFNVISTIVMEKARDIAIMRSIGMPSGDVVAIFIIEGVVVGVVGVILGCLAGWGLAALLHMAPAPTGNAADTLPVKLTPMIFGAASVIALLSAVCAAWLPARRAARADPLTIIRGAA